MTYASEVLADSPLIWLRANGSSTPLADDSGNGRTMPTVGGFTFAQPPAKLGIDGSSLFLPTNSYGRITSSSWFTSLGALSLEAWFNTTSSGALRTIWGCDDDNGTPTATNRKFNLYFDTTGKLTWMSFATGGTQFPYAQHSVSTMDGTWHHVVATRSTSLLSIYVDKVLVATQAITGTLTGSDQDLFLGCIRHAGGGIAYFYNGGLDEMAIYSGELSPTRIAAHFDAGVGTFVPGSQSVALPIEANVGVQLVPVSGTQVYVEQNVKDTAVTLPPQPFAELALTGITQAAFGAEKVWVPATFDALRAQVWIVDPLSNPGSWGIDTTTAV